MRGWNVDETRWWVPEDGVDPRTLSQAQFKHCLIYTQEVKVCVIQTWAKRHKSENSNFCRAGKGLSPVESSSVEVEQQNPRMISATQV